MEKFDVNIKIKVEVKPRGYIENDLEKAEWRSAEKACNYDAFVLGKSLEEYYKEKVIRRMSLDQTNSTESEE